MPNLDWDKYKDPPSSPSGEEECTGTLYASCKVCEGSGCTTCNDSGEEVTPCTNMVEMGTECELCGKFCEYPDPEDYAPDPEEEPWEESF